MTAHYTRSNGQQVPIVDMPYPYLQSAHAKLVRERVDEGRDPEIAAMSARLAEIDALIVEETDQ